jgi:hypothetical protein
MASLFINSIPIINSIPHLVARVHMRGGLRPGEHLIPAKILGELLPLRLLRVEVYEV